MKGKILLVAGFFVASLLPAGHAYAAYNEFFGDILVTNPEAESVSIYSDSTEDSKVKTKLDGGEVLELKTIVMGDTEEDSDNLVWYKISYDEDKSGYVKKEDVLRWEAVQEYLLGEHMVYAAAADDEPVDVFSEKGKKDKIVHSLKDDVCEVTDIGEKYVAVDGVDFSGYVYASDVVFSLKEHEEYLRDKLVEIAVQYVGYPYKWGGTNLKKGVDCSGFTMKIYQMFGVSLPHSSASQSKMGKKIKEKDVLPGDLVFYGKNKKVNHVAIYIGDGKIVHASNRKDGIKISKWKYQKPIVIRRFIK